MIAAATTRSAIIMTTTAIPGAVRRTEPSSQAPIVVVKKSFIKSSFNSDRREENTFSDVNNSLNASLRRYYPVQVIRVDEKSSLSDE